MKPLLKTLCSVFLVSCFGFAGSHAGWIENGVPLTHQWGAVGGGVIASDGSSGAIIAFRACHEGGGHIIAQHVNSLGVVLWGEKGVDVCTATGDPQSPQIISDGAGGAIITWQDYRSGNADIYAQRVDASGTIQWTTDGAPLCTEAGDQYSPTITSDGAGGAIVTWYEYRGGNADIYAQKVNASGAVQWTTNGVALCTATGAQYYPTITSDGAGGAIVTWYDLRSGSDFDIYAQRVNASGVVQWTTDGVALCTATGTQGLPTITSDGAGGAIVTWQDYRRGTLSDISSDIFSDIYTQRVNASGAVQWTANGVALCTATGSQYNPTIISDGAGGAIVTWYDLRSGSDFDIYAQRVNASGAVQWTANGVALCTATGNQYDPTIVSDGWGGAIVTWWDGRSASADIYAQRVNASGAVQWTANGVALCTATGNQQYPQIISDGAGGAIVTWQDYRSASANLYAQRGDTSGAVQWTTDGVALCSAATGSQSSPMITSDGAGGAIVTWIDDRSGNHSIYAQRVNASGTFQWATDGVALCTATGYQLTSDGAGGAIITWENWHNGNADIYAQRVNASGAVQWTANGVALCTKAGDQYSPMIVSDGTGGAIVTWWEYGSVDADIYAQRVNASGAVQWTANGVALCTATGDQWYPQITSDGAGGAIVTWYDQRSGSDWNIYAQRVNDSGAVQWTLNGVALCTATGGQQYPQITSDGAGGAIVTWEDYRGGYTDIYAQKVNASGAVQWTANGVALCTATGDQYSPTIASDGAGGAIVTWGDYRSGYGDIYAQKVNASGAVQWTTDGVALCTATGSQDFPAIVSDGAAGAIVTWDDQRSANYTRDIYSQRVNASGAVQWTTDGVALCTAGGDQQ